MAEAARARQAEQEVAERATPLERLEPRSLIEIGLGHGPKACQAMGTESVSDRKIK